MMMFLALVRTEANCFVDVVAGGATDLVIVLCTIGWTFSAE